MVDKDALKQRILESEERSLELQPEEIRYLVRVIEFEIRASGKAFEGVS